MATAKAYTWTPKTPTGFLNVELENLWAAINAVTGDYVDLSSVQTVGGAKTWSAAAVFSSTAKVNGTAHFADAYGSDLPSAYADDSLAVGDWPNEASMLIRIRDGSSRLSHYWNTAGSGSPTYKTSGEPAMRIKINPQSTEVWTFSYAPSGTAGNAITWEDRFIIDRYGVVTSFTLLRPDYLQPLGSTATLTPNGRSGTHYYMGQSSTNHTIAVPVNMGIGSEFSILFLPHGSTTYSITWNSVYKFAGGTAPTSLVGGNGRTYVKCNMFNTSNIFCMFIENCS